MLMYLKLSVIITEKLLFTLFLLILPKNYCVYIQFKTNKNVEHLTNAIHI